MNLNKEILLHLKDKKNLLAFSHGSDSTALFYALLKAKIPFDLAFVNYKKRAQSDVEENAARNLAAKFHKEIFVKIAPKINKDFQNLARNFRYEFFGEICEKFGYENLILAHNFNDKFEWFLMQLSRGAGIIELLGMNEIEKRDKFTLTRPLLNTPKSEILAFLKSENIEFFNDESNESEKFTRNFIRKHFATPFLQRFERGVKKSFAFLQKDAQSLLNAKITHFEGILKCDKNESVIAKAAKQKGVVMSAAQRIECMKNDCVISGKIAVVFWGEFALIFDYENPTKNTQKNDKSFQSLERENDLNLDNKNALNLNIENNLNLKNENDLNLENKISLNLKHKISQNSKMPKDFKEKCRKLKIPRLLRPYLFKNGVNLAEFMKFACPQGLNLAEF